jgi:hypothetical protein
MRTHGLTDPVIALRRQTDYQFSTNWLSGACGGQDHLEIQSNIRMQARPLAVEAFTLAPRSECRDPSCRRRRGIVSPRSPAGSATSTVSIRRDPSVGRSGRSGKVVGNGKECGRASSGFSPQDGGIAHSETPHLAFPEVFYAADFHEIRLLGACLHSPSPSDVEPLQRWYREIL